MVESLDVFKRIQFKTIHESELKSKGVIYGVDQNGKEYLKNEVLKKIVAI